MIYAALSALSPTHLTDGSWLRTDICPPLRCTQARCPAVVWVPLGLILERQLERRLELAVAEARDAALPRDLGVLLRDGALGPEQGAEGVEAEQEMRPRHGNVGVVLVVFSGASSRPGVL